MMSSRCYNGMVPKMPAGLIELMDGLARDVLKNNPPDVYEFCSDHMKKLLQIRDETEKPTSRVKRVLTLEQKITLAKKVINERAALRREEYDKNIKTYNSDGADNIVTKVEAGDTTKSEQHIKSNVKVHELDLSGNLEHEIVVENMKLNEEGSLLQETNEIIDMPTIAIVEKEQVNNLDEPESAGDEFKDKEEIVSETKENEGSVGDFVVKIKNITEPSTPSESKIDIDVPKTSFEIETTEENTDYSNDKIESKDFMDNNQDVTPSEAIHEENEYEANVNNREHDVNVNNNENGEINTVEELNITVTYVPEKTFQSTDNITQNKEKDISMFVDNSESVSNSQPDLRDSKSENNEITLGENNVEDLKNPNEAKELKNLPSSIIDEHGDKDKSNYQELVSEVNNTSMDLETAAITIQKVFRSFLFRNKTLSSDEATNVDINLLIEDKENKGVTDVQPSNTNKDRRALGLNRIDTVLQTVNEEKSLSLSTDDSSTLSSAATIIQAHVRGFLVRNKFNLNKANSSTSGFDSDGHSTTSFETDNDCRKNKTILNIHIVPEGGHFMSRDESMLTSIDLSVDGSPPDSTTLQPLSYDTSERRKQLKREDAIQSISPPSNNSGKQSIEVDSVKEILELPTTYDQNAISNVNIQEMTNKNAPNNITPASVNDVVAERIALDSLKVETSDSSLPSLTSDEMDVVTPFAATDSDNDSRILHSGEFHDVVLPTKVTRTDTSVVRGE